MSDLAWDNATLGGIAIAIKDGTHGSFRRVRTGVPLLSAKNVTDRGRVAWDDTDDCVSEQDYRAITATFSPQEKDLLITIVGTLGRRAIFDGARIAFQRSVAFVRADESRVSPRFLYHAVGSPDYVRQLARRSNATAQAGLYLGELSKTTIPLPPDPEEQHRIEAVLDIVDEAIAGTESVIAKLKQVRAGLLHDLLTRGLDENGELRDPIAHPDQFRQSSLGRIPKDWCVRTIEECCSEVVDCPHSTPSFSDTGVLVARTMHIRDGRFDEQSASRVSEAEYLERIARLRPQPGDVIFTREAPVGEAFVVPDGMRICLGQRVMLFRPRSDDLIAPYLVAQIYSGAVRRRIDALIGGTTNPHLNVAEVRRFPIPIPSNPSEQERIVEALSASEGSIAAEESVLNKLRALDSGLMADLLTGRVRVPESIPATGVPA